MICDMSNATHVVLLRAINVGGNNKIPMADLRDLLGELGYDDVRTYIQSGNIVLSSQSDSDDIGVAIHDGIKKKFDLDIVVIVRTAAEFTADVAGCPYSDEDPKQVGISFLAEPFSGALDASAFDPDVCTVTPTAVSVFCPSSFAETKLTNAWIEKHSGVPTTMRNWNTSQKLLAMLSE